MTLGRTSADAVPEFELWEAARDAGLSMEAFGALPTPRQAAYVAHRRARLWIAALDAWEARKKTKA